ncbi:hypothetical protein D6C87_05211 [Aureobasidium pullulans]|nr:hypothetical protein D6C87_05211 [Aureobasidium pullulans]
MCTYTYSWYICNHDYYIWTDSVEVCSNRLLSGYSADAWSIGFGEYYCRDCSEDYTLEYELEE